MLAVDGRAVMLDRHLGRFAGGCARLGWLLPADFKADLGGVIRGLLERAGLVAGQARVRLAITAGSGPLDDLAAGEDRLMWLVASALSACPLAVDAVISPWPRNERSPLAGLKCASYAENLMLLDHARRQGCSEGIFFNSAGHLCEAATANVFFASEGALFTPALASGCLPGVTRALVMELAREAGIRCVEGLFSAGDLQAAGEVFLTSATRGPVWVRRLEDRHLPPPSLTPRLRDLWSREILQPAAGTS